MDALSTSEQVQALNQQAWDLRNRDTRQALRCCEESRRLADTIQDRQGLAASLHHSGVCHWVLGEYPVAMDELDQALVLYRAVQDAHGEASALNWMGNTCWRQSNFQGALEYHLQSRRIRAEIGDQVGLAASLNNIGLVYYDLAHYSASLEYLAESLSLFEQAQNQDGISRAVNNLANVYDKLGEEEKALEFYLWSLRIETEEGNLIGQAGSLTNIGTIYRRRKEYDRAIEYHNRALEISHSLDNLLSEAVSLQNLSEVYSDVGRKDEALECLKKCWQTFHEVHDTYSEVEALTGMGNILKDTGRAEEALTCLLDALKYAEEIDSSDLLFHAHQGLSKTFETLGQIPDALEHLKKCLTYREKMYGDETERKTRNLLIKLEVERAQREAEIHRMKNIELAAAYQELQRLDAQKADLLEQLQLKSLELERQSLEDSLTGVYNRRYLDWRLEHEVERSRRYHLDLTVAMIDIDDFKVVNDHFSHRLGDDVLKIVAELLRKGIRSVDAVGRFGGDEFMIIFVETAMKDAISVCERMRRTVAEYDWKSVHADLERVTISIGFYGDSALTSSKELIETADENLYQAKRGGKNRLFAGSELVDEE